MRVQPLALGLVAFAGIACAAPAPLDLVARDGASASDCPGYEASNVKKSDSSITADLTLAGDACDAYGKDIKDLKLLVEYQSSKSQMLKYLFGELYTESCIQGSGKPQQSYACGPILQPYATMHS